LNNYVIAFRRYLESSPFKRRMDASFRWHDEAFF
jgi:hypothetical protein